MRKLSMVDLKNQYKKIKPEIDRAIQEVINQTDFIRGTEVNHFENKLAKYLGSKYTIGCANGTDALQIALMALGLQPGDEVITANFTFVATVEVIALLGLTPVLIDVDPDTFTLDINQIEKNITQKTKAIIPVHLFGQAADMEAVMKIAKKHNLFVIEDAAQAIGAEYTFSDGSTKKLGTIGDIGCTSFFPSKNLGCYGDGGALFCHDKNLSAKIKMITNHGSNVKYYHDEIGVNSRLDSIQAAILNVKIKYLDNYNSSRQKAAAFYDEAFKNETKIISPSRQKGSTHIFHQYTLKVEGISRDLIKEELAKHGIPAMIYYPVPLHKQKGYKTSRFNADELKNSISLSQKVLSLPMHTELDEEQLSYIANKLKLIIKQNS